MQVTYQLTEEDCRQGLKTIHKTALSRWGSRILIAFEILVVLFWLGLLVVDPNGNAFKNLLPLAVIFIVALAATCFLPYVTRSTLRKHLQHTPSAKVPTTLTVSETGLHFQSDYADSTIVWSAFIRWAEVKSVFGLFTAPKFCIVVPKNAFGAGDVDRFRETLRQHIPGLR